jgi:hypothetical protein
LSAEARDFSPLHSSVVHPTSCPINKWGYSGRNVNIDIYLNTDKMLEVKKVVHTLRKEIKKGTGVERERERETKWVKQNKTEDEENEE